MKVQTNLHKTRLSSAPCLFWVGFLLAFAFALPVYAEDSSPFQLDSSRWISFDHYKERLKSGRPLSPTSSDKTETARSAHESDSDEPASSTRTQGTPDSPDSSLSAHTPPVAIAAPTRPINLPLLPGINKGYAISIHSTVDEQPPPVAQITTIDGTPDLHLQEQNWQKASEALRQITHSDSEQSGENQPLNIRMTYLPDPKIAPTPLQPPDVQNRRHAAREKGMKKAAQTAATEIEKSPAEKAACAAIDAYKKQQVEAIQSDRKTLEALQSAISQLGLQKQLDFMTNAQGSVTANTTPSQESSPSPPIAHP